MKILYTLSSGTGDPTKASIPLHLAVNGSVPNGDDVAVLLAGDGTEFLLDGNVEKTEGVGLPPMAELMAKVLEHGIPVYV